jgi:DNA polymerase
MIVARFDGTFEGWRAEARRLVLAGVPPDAVVWDARGAAPLLPGLPAEGSGADAARAPGGELRVPRAFLALARRVACHRAPGRWALLHRLLDRLARGERPGPADADALAVARLAGAIRADVHRIHALARFRRIDPGGGDAPRWVAWLRPDHDTIALAAPHFARRFAEGDRWSLLSPEVSAHFDGALRQGPGVAAAAAPAGDAEAEALWRTFCASTFEPARVNPRLLARHLPERFREHLPEAADLRALTRSASDRPSRPTRGAGARR